MAMKYQKGTVYLRGTKVKMWYGKYTVYLRNKEGKEVNKRRNIALCPKANTPKWKAEQILHGIILKETAVPARTSTAIPDDSVTFRWFVQERYIPMRQGSWSPAYKKTNTYEIEHYLISHFGRLRLRELGTFEIQVWLNGLAEKGYSQSVVRHCFSNIRAITYLAKKQKYLADDPGEDVTMPLTNPVEKPVMAQEQILALLGAIEDAHDLCLLYVGIFCGTRKRGDGLAMEVLDRRGTDTAWHGVRRAVLQGTAQEQGQQRSDPGPGTGSAGARSLASGLPGSFPRGTDVSDLRERRT
jgi:hypothetical protein